MAGKTLRDLFTGDPVENPTLRDVLERPEEEILGLPVDGEERLWACLPGDPVENHLLYSEPNPYLTNPFTMGTLDKVRALKAGTLDVPPEEAALIWAAYRALKSL